MKQLTPRQMNCPITISKFLSFADPIHKPARTGTHQTPVKRSTYFRSVAPMRPGTQTGPELRPAHVMIDAQQFQTQTKCCNTGADRPTVRPNKETVIHQMVKTSKYHDNHQRMYHNRRWMRHDTVISPVMQLTPCKPFKLSEVRCLGLAYAGFSNSLNDVGGDGDDGGGGDGNAHLLLVNIRLLYPPRFP